MMQIYVLCANNWIPVDINEQYHYMNVENVPKYDVSNPIEKFVMYERYMYEAQCFVRYGELKSYAMVGNKFQIHTIMPFPIENISRPDFYKRRNSLQNTDILHYFSNYSIRRAVTNTAIFDCGVHRMKNLDKYDVLLFTNFTQLFQSKTGCAYNKNESDKSMITLNCIYHKHNFGDNLRTFLGVKQYTLEPKPFMRAHSGVLRPFDRRTVRIRKVKMGTDKNSIVMKINNGNNIKYNSICVEWTLTIYIIIPQYITGIRSGNFALTFRSPIFCDEKNKPNGISTGRTKDYKLSVTPAFLRGEYRNQSVYNSGFSIPEIHTSTHIWTDTKYDIHHLLTAHTIIPFIIVLISLTIAIIGLIWWLSFKLIKQVKIDEQCVMD